MRAILDINVVIALFDADHVFHQRAHAWWGLNRKHGWASCPLTENGVVRIMSNPAYSAQARFSPADLIGRIRTFVANTNHEFWPDDVSIRDATVVVAGRIHGGRQLTDVYLLALAVRHKGRLATFDTSIPLTSVPSATEKHLVAV